MNLTIQTLLKYKVFGDCLPGTRPLGYRAREWQDLVRGRDRAASLITRAMLGVPSAHHEQDLPMWCFQFPDGGLLVVYIHRGSPQVQFAQKDEEHSRDLRAAVDFLIGEMAHKLKLV